MNSLEDKASVPGRQPCEVGIGFGRGEKEN